MSDGEPRSDLVESTRRGVLKGAAGLGAVGVLGTVGTGSVSADTNVSTIDEQFDLSATGRLEAIVVFDARNAMDRLLDLSLPDGHHEYDVLPMTYTTLTTDQIEEVASWASVRRVRANEELEYYNDDATAITGADAVRSDLGYDGSGVDVAVIDSGFSGPHPDFDGRVDSNWRWVDDPLGEKDPDWTDLGPDTDTDNLGHGTHCMGIIGGDGADSDGKYAGMAPGTELSMHMASETVYVSYAVGAWDHVLARKDDPDVDFDASIVSNSYGVARDIDYNPNDPINVATWEAYERDMIVCFAAGNDGPGVDTLSRFSKAPHVLCVGASNDQKEVTDFSSRGRTPDEDRETNYDRKTALRELGKYNAAMTDSSRDLEDGRFAGTLGPTGTGSNFHAVETGKQADSLDLRLGITPDGEQISLIVHEGSKDGTEVAKLGEEPVYQHKSISVDVDGGTTYWVELEPATNVYVDYTVDWTTTEQVKGEPSNYGPVGVYRPALLTPGNDVVSTIGPTDPLDAAATDDMAYYTPMSGTSMATPGCAGIAALMVDAAHENGHEVDPIDVINTLEATAAEAHTEYTPWNAGAGFTDARTAVERAAAGDWATFSETDLSDT